MSSKSGISGTTRLRRTLRRIDPEVTRQVRDVVDEGLQAVVADAIQLVPRDSGDLARSIDYKTARDGLTGVAGPGAQAAEIKRRRSGSAFGVTDRKNRPVRLSKRNKNLFWQFLKGYWIEFGTKGAPEKNIPAQPARPFMRPAWDMNRTWIMGRARKAVARALERASRG